MKFVYFLLFCLILAAASGFLRGFFEALTGVDIAFSHGLALGCVIGFYAHKKKVFD